MLSTKNIKKIIIVKLTNPNELLRLSEIRSTKSLELAAKLLNN